MVHLSKCWRGTCSCVGMLRGHMGNKRLGTPVLKTRSIKICRSLLRVPRDDCASSYFRPTAFNDTALCIACLASGNTIAISTGESNKNVTVKFLKKHITYVNFTSFFFAVLNSSTQNTQFPKKTNTPQSLRSDRKDNGCKNLARTRKKRLVKHSKWLQLLGS